MAEAPEYDTLKVTVEDGVAVVTINRPDKRNALNAQVRADLTAALEALEGDDAARVVVLTGAGDKAFVAGADVAEFADRTAEEQRPHSEPPRVYEVVAGYPKPVIAAINGYCLGGGNELALACDVRVASDRAKLGQPEIRLGLMPGGGATQRLPRVVGEGQAMRLILTGDIIDAAEARDIGLVDFVVPHDELLPFATELAGRMASKSPVALERAKTAVRAAQQLPLNEGLLGEARLFVSLFETEDMREGTTAFLEGRKPQWKGR